MHLHLVNVLELVDDYIMENILERQSMMTRLAEEGDELTNDELSDIHKAANALYAEYKRLMRLRNETTPTMAVAFYSHRQPAVC